MTVQIRDSDGTVRLSGDLLATGGATGDVLTQQADGTYAPAAGGGSSAVGCVLARDAPFDIHAIGNHDILWDALYDNLWDLDPLVAIPAGLGLTFAFDGSSSLVVPTEAGIWSFSYSGVRATDSGAGLWVGTVVTGIGLSFPWIQPLGNGVPAGIPLLSSSFATPLPTGTQLTHQVATVSAADANPLDVSQVYLSIVRLG